MHLGIDVGTQGLSVVLTEASSPYRVVAVGDGKPYAMVPDLDDECYEQRPDDWLVALRSAMEDLRAKLKSTDGSLPSVGVECALTKVESIGISGQMHGEVLTDASGLAIAPARIWCDGRNGDEGDQLTKLFGAKIPRRATVARWLWTCRNRLDLAKHTKHMTTPAGYIAFHLTGAMNLGVGEAAGMFPIDQSTMSYNEEYLAKFDDCLRLGNLIDKVRPIRSILPRPRVAGQDGGSLTKSASSSYLCDLVPPGIPVAPAEGDQVAALAGSLISRPGQVSCSFGTSVCANSVGDRPFVGVSPAVDHFCAADGRPINMIWLQNGTTYMNAMVEMFGTVLPADDRRSEGFGAIIPLLLSSPPDCGGLLALPFMDSEPGLGISSGGSAMLIGLSAENATPGNAAKAALLGTMFNLRLGQEGLMEQGYPRDELILSGGLTKTPELGQILADVFSAPVLLLDSAEEGTAWGAALMAAFRQRAVHGSTETWEVFLSNIDRGDVQRFYPDLKRAREYDQVYKRYSRLVGTVPAVVEASGR